MPPSRKSRITLLSNNLFGVFIGLFLGLLLAVPFYVSIIVLVVTLAFSWYRFGFLAMLFILGGYLSGLLIRLIPVAYPPQDGFHAIVIDARDNYAIVQSGLARAYVYAPDNDYQVGDILKLSGAWSPLRFSHLESQFDFAAYLSNRGVGRQLDNPQISRVFAWPFRIKPIKEIFLSRFDATTGAYIKTLVFGEAANDDMQRHFDRLGIIHLFGVSGLVAHGYVAAIAKLLSLRLSEERARRWATLGLLPWLFFNPTSIVLWRLLLQAIINEWNRRYFDKRMLYWSIKGAVGIIMSLFSRYIVNSPSFYLSFYLASAMHLIKQTKAISLKDKIAMRLWPLILLLPYVAAVNARINLVSFLLYLPLVYLNAALVLVAIVQLVTVPIPFLVIPFVRLNEVLTSWATAIEITVNFADWSIVKALAYFALLVVVLLVRDWSLKKMQRKAGTVLVLATLLMAFPVSNLCEQSIHFINVGQGDAILIKNRHKAVLVDTGGSLYLDVATEVLIPYFHKHGIDKVDVTLITHDDFDHSGALPSLREHFQVGEVVSHPEGFPLIRCGITFDNLNAITQDVDANMASLVLAFSFIGSRWLFMGDAPVAVEEDIVGRHPDLNVDYVKIGHHGSSTSSCYDFIKTITPKEAIISVGKNYYGHPHQDVLETLTRLGIVIRRTDIEGTIVYKNGLRLV